MTGAITSCPSGSNSASCQDNFEPVCGFSNTGLRI